MMAKTEPGADGLRGALGGISGPGANETGPGLPAGFCGDIDMRIARDGVWYYLGTPIGRKPLVRLFSTVLTRDEAGDYWLVTPVERARIVVDDAPFLAVEMTVDGEGTTQSLAFRTNVDDWVRAGAEHPLALRPRPESGELAPYLRVLGALDALVVRAVYYDLVALGVGRETADGPVFGVWSDGVFFPFGPEPA